MLIIFAKYALNLIYHKLTSEPFTFSFIDNNISSIVSYVIFINHGTIDLSKYNKFKYEKDIVMKQPYTLNIGRKNHNNNT